MYIFNPSLAKLFGLFAFLVIRTNIIQAQESSNQVRKNQMTVKWEIQNDSIFFELEAPTTGWIAIGFNESESLSGTYLIMGRIKGGRPEVVEHYVEKPGLYKPISEYGVLNRVISVWGEESKKGTILRFSLPTFKTSKYHKELRSKSKWCLLIAYSRDDDFQHHSAMRSSVNIIL